MDNGWQHIAPEVRSARARTAAIARAASLTPERRSEIARLGAAARDRNLPPGPPCAVCGRLARPGSPFCRRPHHVPKVCGNCGTAFLAAPGRKFCAPPCGVRFHSRAYRHRLEANALKP